MAIASNLAQLVAALPEIYQPIFGHPELSASVSRTCDHRYATIGRVYDLLATDLGRPLRVLDLGCAQGWFSLELARRGADVRGVDFNAANVAVCRELAARHPELAIGFEQADIEQAIPRLGEGEFDLALGLSVFHHLCEKHGKAFVQALLAQLIAKVPCALLELALAGEPPPWSRALPENPDDLLEPIPFFRVLSRHPTHLSSLHRPLYFCSRTHWLLKGLERFGHWNRREGRRTYTGAGRTAKLYPPQPAHARAIERETAFLEATHPELAPLPRVLETGAGEGHLWLVTESTEGESVADLIRGQRPYDEAAILRQVLRRLVAWERCELFDLDLRAAHVTIGDGGIGIADGGALVTDRSELAWPPQPFVSFWVFVHQLLNRVEVGSGPPEPRHYRPEHLPAPYAAWSLAFWALPFEQWNFSRLADSLPGGSAARDQRERLLAPLGYQARYQVRPKYRGAEIGEVCLASKAGHEYFVVKDAGHFARLQTIQESIPHMARIALRVDDCVLFHRAAGRLLWDYEEPPDASALESQLLAFAEATRRHGLIHGDLRPWNLFFDPETGGVEVIDWGHGGFVDELRVGGFALGHIKQTNHSDWLVADLASIDLEDARRLIRLVKGEIGLKEAWGHEGLRWLPPWCRP